MSEHTSPDLSRPQGTDRIVVMPLIVESRDAQLWRQASMANEHSEHTDDSEHLEDEASTVHEAGSDGSGGAAPAGEPGGGHDDGSLHGSTGAENKSTTDEPKKGGSKRVAITVMSVGALTVALSGGALLLHPSLLSAVTGSEPQTEPDTAAAEGPSSLFADQGSQAPESLVPSPEMKKGSSPNTAPPQPTLDAAPSRSEQVASDSNKPQTGEDVSAVASSDDEPALGVEASEANERAPAKKPDQGQRNSLGLGGDDTVVDREAREGAANSEGQDVARMPEVISPAATASNIFKPGDDPTLQPEEAKTPAPDSKLATEDDESPGEDSEVTSTSQTTKSSADPAASGGQDAARTTNALRLTGINVGESAADFTPDAGASNMSAEGKSQPAAVEAERARSANLAPELKTYVDARFDAISEQVASLKEDLGGQTSSSDDVSSASTDAADNETTERADTEQSQAVANNDHPDAETDEPANDQKLSREENSVADASNGQGSDLEHEAVAAKLEKLQKRNAELVSENEELTEQVDTLQGRVSWVNKLRAKLKAKLAAKPSKSTYPSWNAIGFGNGSAIISGPAQETKVVHVGDSLWDTRVVRIDPEHRVVATTKGVIEAD